MLSLVLLLIFRYSCVILAATIKVDPKPIASWRGYARSLKLTIVQFKALQGFVGLGGVVQVTPPSPLPYRVPGHSGRGYARP